MFLLSQVYISLKQNFIFNGVVILVLSFVLSMQVLWSVKPKVDFERKLLNYSFFIAFSLFELAVFLSFLPIRSYIYALFITGIYYCLTGLLYNYLDQKLFKPTIREYVIVFSTVMAILVISVFTYLQ